jgi:pimeloyl-ACP methyl ester carboxylesterase
VIGAGIALHALIALATSTPPAPCTLEGPQGTRAWGECGTVDVAVDPARPTPVIAVGFARLRATGVDDVGAPMVFLAGGPGQAATRDFVPTLAAFDELRARHDIVLVDVRGTGRSTPQRCVDDRPLEAQVAGVGDDDIFAACAAALTIDPRFLTTGDAARDVDAVRVALGIDRWHVLGVSYGTRLAIVYDQHFVGRALTLTLDGVAPLDRALGEDVAVDMTSSLRALGEDVVASFASVRARLAAAPQTVQARHPTTGSPVQLTITSEHVGGVVRMLLYATETRAVLPHVLRAARDGDLAPLVGLAILSGEQMRATIHTPVNASVLCSEDVPFFSAAPVVDAVFDDERPQLLRQCVKWPKAPPARLAFKGTTTPTLLLSGEFDPITPPRHVVRVLDRFVDAVHVVAPGQGHNVMARGCIPDVIADFVDAGTAKGLRASCVNDLAALPSFVDALGPKP